VWPGTLGFHESRSEQTVAARIRLLRMGKIRNPQYRIVVADARTKRDGRVIEFIGIYHPKEEPSLIEVNSDRAQHWLKVGAQPSDPVRAILSKTGDWQKFKGLPAPEPLKVAAPRADRRAVYEAESQAAAGVAVTETKPANEARPARKTAAKKAAEPKADAPTEPAATSAAAPAATSDVAPADAAPAAAPPADAAAATAPPADAAPAVEQTEEQVDAGAGENA
jgi:small subunit ribosomal protein S16